ncbi:MAG: hypothetical protein ACJAY2_003607 [Pseudomonadales bacterium]|jgi:hypothetical protein
MSTSKLSYSAAYTNHSPPPIPESVGQAVNTWTRVAHIAPSRNQISGNYLSRIVGVASAICLSFLMGFATSKLTQSTTFFKSTQLNISLAEASDIV